MRSDPRLDSGPLRGGQHSSALRSRCPRSDPRREHEGGVWVGAHEVEVGARAKGGWVGGGGRWSATEQ